jgi:hypothetical protein
LGAVMPDGRTPYERAVALLFASVGAAVFYPLARGKATDQWFELFFAWGSLAVVANELALALSGPWWWYAATLLLGGVLAISAPVEAGARRMAMILGLLGLVSAPLWGGAWRGGSASQFKQCVTVAAIVGAVCTLAALVRHRLHPIRVDGTTPSH